MGAALVSSWPDLAATLGASAVRAANVPAFRFATTQSPARACAGLQLRTSGVGLCRDWRLLDGGLTMGVRRKQKAIDFAKRCRNWQAGRDRRDELPTLHGDPDDACRRQHAGPTTESITH